MHADAVQLQKIAGKLHELYGLALAAERTNHPGLGGYPLLDKLMNDPQWQWLRPLSSLMADVDNALSHKDAITPHEHAYVATRLRGLLYNAGEFIDENFLQHYRPLLQLSLELASAHGELKGILRDSPFESEDEAERLHARHTWAMRHKRG